MIFSWLTVETLQVPPSAAPRPGISLQPENVQPPLSHVFRPLHNYTPRPMAGSLVSAGFSVCPLANQLIYLIR